MPASLRLEELVYFFFQKEEGIDAAKLKDERLKPLFRSFSVLCGSLSGSGRDPPLIGLVDKEIDKRLMKANWFRWMRGFIEFAIIDELLRGF